MSRKKKTKRSSSSKKSSSRGPGRLRRWWDSLGDDGRASVRTGAGWALAAALIAVGVAFAFKGLERRVFTAPSTAAPVAGPVRIHFADAPPWMPGALAGRIAESVVPPGARYSDESLTRGVYALATANPWVRQVSEVRKAGADPDGGTVEVRAEFRRPAARVVYEGKYYYVDSEGVRLPADEAPEWVVVRRSRGARTEQVCYAGRASVPIEAFRENRAGRIHYILIDGVDNPPPPVGETWTGEDLADGLRLAELVESRPYGNQITVVDVRNHDYEITRSEPQLRMYAQVGRGRRTDIRFGRFPAPGGGDYVVSPERKMYYLDRYAERNDGMLAGVNGYIDLRYDDGVHVDLN